MRERERIAALDILRGVAILGILYLNIPIMGNEGIMVNAVGDPRLLGWGTADQWAYRYVFTILDGTQRGLLELLFGASAVILAARAPTSEGPIEVADIYYRRALLLIAFGALHGTVLLWSGEIWTYYGIAALLIFPFRQLSRRVLLGIGTLGLAALMAIQLPSTLDKVELMHRVERIEAQPKGQPSTKADQADQKQWQEMLDERANLAKQIPDQGKAIKGSYVDNFANSALLWSLGFSYFVLPDVGEAFFTMLIGMALFKWGALSGDRSRRFYLVLSLVGYAIGIPVKLAIIDFAANHHFGPVRINSVLYDYGRMATTIGHVGLVCLALKSGLGRRILAVFKAPGKMPMTTYVGQTLICCWLLFPGFGLGLWGRYGWTALLLIATAVNAALAILCAVWLRHFTMGPFEWLLRWTSYLERPVLRRIACEAVERRKQEKPGLGA